MTTILDVFLEISNSKECLDLIFKKYITSTQKSNLNINMANNRLKTILKQNDKKCLVGKYKKISGDTLIILSKQIATEALNRYKSTENILEFIKSDEARELMDLEKFCIGIINFNEKLKDNLDLIVENYKQNNYIFKGIKDLEINEDVVLNPSFEVEMESIKIQMKNIQNRLEILDRENISLKNENKNLKNKNKNLNDENKLLKKENKKIKTDIEKIEKDILKKSEENDIRLSEAFNLKEQLRLKEKSIIDLNQTIKNQGETLKNAIIVDEFTRPEIVKKNICMLHTSELFLVDKIYYDVKFIKYTDVVNELRTYFKKLRQEGIFTVGLQSNSIGSFKIQQILSMAKDEKIQMYRLSFNTEKELCEKLNILK